MLMLHLNCLTLCVSSFRTLLLYPHAATLAVTTVVDPALNCAKHHLTIAPSFHYAAGILLL